MMNLNRILSLSLSAVLLLTLTSCGPDAAGSGSSSPPASDFSQQAESPDQAAQLPFTLAFFPELSLHPVLSTSRANLTLSSLLYEPLFQVGPQFQVVPVLCQDHTVSEDKLTWTFALRPGITFSDGTPLTGSTVAEALELARTPDSRYAQRLRDISSITGDERSITITLVRPNGRLPLLLDIPIALGGGTRPAGTGPYVLGGTEDDPRLLARTGWWQSNQSLPTEHFPLQTAHQDEDLIHAFDTGDLSLVDVDLMGTNSPVYAANSETRDYATTTMLYLGFNTQRGICKRADVRQALCRAVDRKALVNIVYANHASPAALPVHPASALYDTAVARHLDYAPQQLLNLLANTNTASRELVLLVNSENSAKLSAAQLITYQLEAAGIPVKLKKLPFESYEAALASGSFDLYLGEVALTADFDLSPLLVQGGPLNYGGWASQQAPALLAALAAASPEEAPRAALALFALLEQDPPLAVLCFKNGSVLTQWGRLDGLTPVRGNVFYQLENWIIK